MKPMSTHTVPAVKKAIVPKTEDPPETPPKRKKPPTTPMVVFAATTADPATFSAAGHAIQVSAMFNARSVARKAAFAGGLAASRTRRTARHS